MVDRLIKLLSEFEAQGFANAYNKSQDERKHFRVNIFNIISDSYRREKMHSDVIKFLLDLGEEDWGAKPNVVAFVEYLRDQFGLDISPEDYQDSIVEKEVAHGGGFVDILIQGRSSHSDRPHAIIIENKIADAPDQPHQIPDYYHSVKRTATVDAAVYLSLRGLKSPETLTWEAADSDLFTSGKLLVAVAASSGERNDLASGWLPKCLEQTEDEDFRYLVRHYAELLKYLGGLAMPYADLNEFYRFILKDDNFKVAKTLEEYTAALVPFRARQIFEKYRLHPAPFQRMRYYEGDQPCFEYLKVSSKATMKWIKLVLHTEPDRYWIEFFHQDGDSETVRAVLERISLLDRFRHEKEDDRYYAENFSFPKGEEAFFDFVDDFLRRLSKLK